jgi:raffinose/stachyose/melibiose transport system permease protein
VKRLAFSNPRRVSPVSIAVVIVALVVVGVPFWVLIVNSLKPFSESITPNLALPQQWNGISNYSTVLTEANVVRGFLNTTIITVGVIPVVLLLGSAAAWVFARGMSRALSPLYYLMLMGVAIPPSIVASIFVLKAMGLYGSMLGLGLLYVAIYLPFAVFLITGFVKSIPVELEEAARIDGASHYAVFLRIVLPLLTPVLVTAGLLIAVSLWNDFLNPFMLLRGSASNTLTLTVFDFATSSTAEATYQWNLVFADILVTSIPMLVLYYLAQRYIVHGLSGAGK